jgi:CubicO group peptidase (beta-lactamase class C family)
MPFDLEQTKEVLSAEILRALEYADIPSISIALVREDEIVWTAAYGYANLRSRTRATPETLYNALSTFKAVTATAVMQFVERRQIGLDDPVNEHLGDTPIRDRLQSDKPVTLRHILSHWSGLLPDTNGTNQAPLWTRARGQLKTLPEITACLCSIRSPEERWEYNDLAYALAGSLIEKLSGTAYQDYILDNVLKPLGVRTPAPVFPTPEMVELMSLPYVRENGHVKPAEQVQYTFYPAGDAFTTAEDMARFLGAHLNGGAFNGSQILSAESVQEMHTSLYGGDYGLGFHVSMDDAGHRIISHTGGGETNYASVLMGDVDARVGVYCVSNLGAPFPFDPRIAIELLRGDYVLPGQRQTVQLDPEELIRYVGRYEDEEDLVLRIAREGNHLYIRTPWEPKTELVAESETRFYAKQSEVTAVDLTFILDGGDTVAQMLLYWQGMEIPLQKVT